MGIGRDPAREDARSPALVSVYHAARTRVERGSEAETGPRRLQPMSMVRHNAGVVLCFLT